MSHLTVTRDEYDLLVALNHDGRWALTRPASAVATPEAYGDDVIVLDYDQEVAREVGYMRVILHRVERGECCLVMLGFRDPRRPSGRVPLVEVFDTVDDAAERAGRFTPRVKVYAIQKLLSFDDVLEMAR